MASARAQTLQLAYSEECSRLDSKLVLEACDGRRAVQLRERLRRIGLNLAVEPARTEYRLAVGITIALDGRYVVNLRSGGRVRDLTTAQVDVTLRRGDSTLAERHFEIDSHACGASVDDGPSYVVLATLAAAGLLPGEVLRVIAEEFDFPIGVCGTAPDVLETLRTARTSLVPLLKPLLADSRRSPGAAHMLASMGSGEATAALRMHLQVLTRTNTLASLQAGVDLVNRFTENLGYVPADEIEPQARAEAREMLRILTAPPYPAQKRRFYAAGMFYDWAIKSLTETIEPKPEER